MELPNFPDKPKILADRVMRTEPDALEYDVRSKRTWAWTQVEKLAAKAAAEAIRLAALREYLKRTDPEPSTHQTLNLNGPVLLGWKEPTSTPMKSSSPALPNGPSSSSSDASTSSSATEDSARRFWQ